MQMKNFTAREEAFAVSLYDAGVFTGHSFDFRAPQAGGVLTSSMVHEIGIILCGALYFHENELYPNRVGGFRGIGEAFALSLSEASATRRKISPIHWSGGGENSSSPEVSGVYAKFCRGDRVLMVGDVLTQDHTLKIEEMEAIQEAGLIVEGLLVLLDLGWSNCATLFSKFPQLKICSMFGLTDLLEVGLKHGRLTQKQHDSVSVRMIHG